MTSGKKDDPKAGELPMDDPSKGKGEKPAEDAAERVASAGPEARVGDNPLPNEPDTYDPNDPRPDGNRDDPMTGRHPPGYDPTHEPGEFQGFNQDATKTDADLEMAWLGDALEQRGYGAANPAKGAIDAIDGLERDADKAARAGNGGGGKRRPSYAGDPGRKGRKVGPPKGETVDMAPAELIERINDAEEVEIVFSDGENEITGLPPVPVIGNNPWRTTGAGLLLQNTEIELHGPGYGQTAYQIAGYGLFLDGKLAAYRQRPDVVNVGVNQTVKLVDDVVF